MIMNPLRARAMEQNSAIHALEGSPESFKVFLFWLFYLWLGTASVPSYLKKQKQTPVAENVQVHRILHTILRKHYM